jgi:hypothetical protein
MSQNAVAVDLVVDANIGNVPWESQGSSVKFVGFEINLVKEFDRRLRGSGRMPRA